MDRRLAGALLVLLTFVGAAVISSATGTGVAGSPTAVALPDPPAVGDCLLAEPAEGPAAVPPIGSPAPAFGPCGAAFGSANESAGEVVTVRALIGTDRSTASDSAGCRSSALEYAGLRARGDAFTVPGTPADDPIQWKYSFDVRTTWVTQVPSQPGASTWAACVARPARGAAGPGRLIDAFSAGTLPGAYGTCWQSVDLTAAVEMVGCDEPHVAELIALGRGARDVPLDAEQVRQSCLTQAAVVLRRADPTVGGELTVRTQPDRIPSGRIGLSPACFITASDGRLMVGSLVGLGSMPVIFAG